VWSSPGSAAGAGGGSGPSSAAWAASAVRIGARNNDVVVDKNRIRSASGNGIDVTSGEPRRPATAPKNVSMLKNKVTHAELLGIDVTASAGREYEVRGNRALDNGKVGIHLGPRADDVQVIGNTALGNGGTDGFDCQDESDGEGATDGTAGTENIWQDNVGVRATRRASAPPLPARSSPPATVGTTTSSGVTSSGVTGSQAVESQAAPQARQGPPEAPPGPVRMQHAPWRF
jgi:hypothetical protein